MMDAGTLLQIKEQLLRRPSLINARAAAIAIICERYKCQAHAAENRLDELHSDNVINALFKEVLPWHYQRALSSRSRLSLSEQFFRVIGFPVSDVWMSDIIYDGEDPAIYSIPICSMNPGIWNGDYAFDDLPLVDQMAVLIYRPGQSYWHAQKDDGKEAWQYLVEKYGINSALRPTGAISIRALITLFKKQKNPLRFIPLEINVIDYNTGSIFYDFDYEMEAPDIPWSKENIEWLRKQYKLARSLESKIDSLNKWLLRKPQERIEQVCRLYSQLRKVRNEQGNST